MAFHNFRAHYKCDSVSKNYSKHRPNYPQKIYDVIISYHKESPSAGFEFAVDVGCGTGQSTMPLANYFKKVTGVDVSESQINRCSKDNPKVSFRVGAAEDLSFLETNSVDLLTSAAALHWLDREKFFNEVYRVLKPGGTIAAYSYELDYFHCPALMKYITEVRQDFLQDYLTNRESMGVLYEKYRTITMPMMTDVKHVDVMSFEKEFLIDDYISYLKSLSYIDRYMRDHPGHDFLGEVRNDLIGILRSQEDCDHDTRDEELTIKPVFDIFMLAGRKPMKPLSN